jgi:DNA-binding CsgD family transcriptional regulator
VTGAPEALARLTEAIEQLPAADDRAGTALETGRILMALGRVGEAGAAFDLGLRHAEDAKGDAAGLLRAASMTAARLQRGRAGKPAAPGLVAPQNGDTPADRALLAQIALDAALRGDPHERVREWATEALARGALLEDDGAEGVVYYLATTALTLVEDLQMAEVALAAAVDDARSRSSALAFATASHFQSFAVLRRGRLPAAAEAARAAIEGARHGWRFALGSAHAVLAGALTEAGDLDAAEREIDLAEELTSKDAASRVAHHGGRGVLHLARGRPAQALTDFLDCGETLIAADAPNPAVLPWRTGAARALAALGDRTEARRYAEEELALAEAFGAPGSIGRSLRTIGALAGGKRSIEPLQAAVACLEESQTALERARALVDLGSALRRARHTRDSREPLRRGLDLAQRCGAAELTERAMREVTAAGARPRRIALHGLEALTPRELQTAELAAAGRSNREIADALVVTVKTVEWHLKHTYGKLGISSRGELAEALGRRPNVSPPRP